MPFTADGQSRDTTPVRAGEDKEVYIATFSLEKLREWRAREIWGDAFQRPRYYHPLIWLQVEPPFVRPEARRQAIAAAPNSLLPANMTTCWSLDTN
jgi:hypothetical protein